MKTKGKGKAITGIALAAIMVASVFVAMIGTTGADSIGGPYNIIEDNSTYVQSVLIGQALDFDTNFPSRVTIYRVKDDAVVWTKMAGTDNTLAISGDDWKKEGAYYVNYAGVGSYDAQLSFSDPDVPLKLKVDTKEVSSLTQGTNLAIDTSGINLFDLDRVDLEIIGPVGKITYKNNQDFSNITVDALREFGNTTNTSALINTSGWKIGDYTFQVKTKSAYACGLDASSAKKELTIVKGKIDISAEKTTATELESIKLTVTGVSKDTIWLNATGPHVLFVGGVENTPIEADKQNNFKDKIDEDGKRTYVVKFDETGSYTITVTVKGGDRNGDDDTVDITVTEKGVTFDLPITVVIGEKFTMKGTANTGDSVDIFVDGVLYKKLDDLVLEDGEFSEEVTAGTAIGMDVPGSIRLKAWIDCGLVGTDVGYPYPPTTPTDGDTAVLLVVPGLAAEISVETVAQEDSFYVTGTARGAKSVDVLTISPKGASGKGMDPATSDYKGLTYKKPSVSDIGDSFSQKITVDENAGTGSYLVAVSYKGRDGHYGNLENESIDLALVEGYGSLAGKTQEQVVEMLVDLTTSAGADDLIWLGKIKVEAARVTLDTIADVAIGEPLAVAGVTNREEGHTILITVKGPVELTPEIALVENGTFSATFDTSEAVVGTYTVTADDGDGHTDDTTVEIVKEIVPIATPTPTAKPTAAAVPTAVATAEPTPTPTEEPGFEAVFAIAGLLSIAYLVLRRRK